MHEQWETEPAEASQSSALDAQPVVIAWALLGAVLGMGYSLTTRMTDGDQRGAVWVVSAIALGSITGWLVHKLERSWSRERRGPHGSTGPIDRAASLRGVCRSSRIRDPWFALARGGWCAHTHSLLAAEAFLVSTTLVFWGVWRAWCSHQLNAALMLVSDGKVSDGGAFAHARRPCARPPVSDERKAHCTLNPARLAFADRSVVCCAYLF